MSCTEPIVRQEKPPGIRACSISMLSAWSTCIYTVIIIIEKNRSHTLVLSRCIVCTCMLVTRVLPSWSTSSGWRSHKVCSKWCSEENIVTKCRKELQYKQPNGIIGKFVLSVQEEGSIAKTKCLAHELSECACQLHGLVVEQPVRHGSEESRESEGLKYKYATGYLQYTSPTTWNLWLQTFQL